MRFEACEVTGFGRLTAARFEFGPGLNLVFGPNEAGKSTLQTFLQAMLYGLQKPGAARRQPLPELERYRPWGGAPYRGSLVLVLADGRRLRVERDFDSERGGARVFDEATGQELTRQFPQDRRKELLFAHALLGLHDAEFADTACIGQLQASRLREAGELASRLSRLRDGGRDDASPRAALELLRRAVTEQIGSDQSRKTPFAEARDRCRELEAELAAARAGQAAVFERLTQFRQARARLERARAEAAAARRRFAAARAAEIRELLATVESARAALGPLQEELSRWSAYAAFPTARLAEARALGARLEAAEARLPAARAAVERAESAWREAAAAAEAFAPLLGLAGLDAPAAARAAERRRALRAELAREAADAARARGELERVAREREALGAAGAGPEALERLDQLEAEVAQLASEQDLGRLAPLQAALAERGRALRATLWLGFGGAALLALAGALLGWFLASGWAWLALAAAPWAAWAAVRRRALVAAYADAEDEWRQASEKAARTSAAALAARAALERLLAGSGASSTAELRRRCHEHARLAEEEARLREQEARSRAQLARLKRELGDVDARLEEPLAAAAQVAAATGGVPGLEGAAPERDGGGEDARETRVAALLDALPRFLGRAAELDRARADALAALERARADLGDRAGERDRIAAELADLLRGAGVGSLESFEEGARRRAAYESALAAAEEQRNRIAVALGQADEASLRAELDALAAELPQGTPGEIDAGDDVAAPERARRRADLEAAWRRADAEAAALALEAQRLQGQVEVEPAHRPPDEIERELAEWTERLQALRAQRDALELAAAHLEEAIQEVHREFAPRLNQRVAELVEAITGGRYRDVRVAPDLGLRVFDPGTGALRSASDLSSGALDQMYLALRFAMAELLGRPDEPPPLLLDDSFVQLDEGRLRGCLAYLYSRCAAAGQQAFLFTCHERELRAAQALDPGGLCRVLRL